jgi:hypothetical protein
VGADVLAVVEAEDRPSLVRFNDKMLNGRSVSLERVERGRVDVACGCRPRRALNRSRPAPAPRP